MDHVQGRTSFSDKQPQTEEEMPDEIDIPSSPAQPEEWQSQNQEEPAQPEDSQEEEEQLQAQEPLSRLEVIDNQNVMDVQFPSQMNLQSIKGWRNVVYTGTI